MFACSYSFTLSMFIDVFKPIAMWLFFSITIFSFVPLVFSNSIPDGIWRSSELRSYEECKSRFPEFSSRWDPRTEMNDIPTRNIQGLLNGVSTVRTWPNGRVPYYLSGSFSTTEMKKLACAMLFFHEKTCVRFVPHQGNDNNYIRVQKKLKDGCYSTLVGMLESGEQVINFDDWCWRHGTLVHELMHAIGFFHEQSRDDREKYIKVNWHNIGEGWESQYKTSSQQGYSVKLYGTYDYSSVMHYGRDSRKPSMDAIRSPVQQNNGKMGNRDGATAQDTYKINKMYSCSSGGGGTTRPNTETPTRTTSNTGCRDKSSNCNRYKSYCRTQNMKENCAKTCNACGGYTTKPGSCRDISVNCADNRSYCRTSSMRKNCAKTCNVC